MRLIAAAIWFLALTAQTAVAQVQSPPIGARQNGQGQRADPDYDASVARPTYTTSHPTVLVDAAHHNRHTADTGYRPFAQLIANDGYRVVSNTQPFSAAALAGGDILVVVNASAGAGIENYGSPAFTDEECRAVADWGALRRLAPADRGPCAVRRRRRADGGGVRGRHEQAGRSPYSSGVHARNDYSCSQ